MANRTINDSNRSHLSDEELLAAYQQADPRAFEEFFCRHKRLIYCFLYSKLGSRFEAEEAFQRTFFKIHRYILKYDPMQSALGWVITIARNVAWDLKAKGAALTSLDDVPNQEFSVDQQGAIEARKTLTELLKQLAPKDQHLIERRFLNEESFEEIAASEGWTVENTRQKVSRLMRRIRRAYAL